jgi:hypothetical protein
LDWKVRKRKEQTLTIGGAKRNYHPPGQEDVMDTIKRFVSILTCFTAGLFPMVVWHDLFCPNAAMAGTSASKLALFGFTLTVYTTTRTERLPWYALRG